jgi:hypothetical protein
MILRRLSLVYYISVFLVLLGCSLDRKDKSHKEMLKLLEQSRARFTSAKNPFDSHSKIPFVDSLINLPRSSEQEKKSRTYIKATVLLELGREQEAVDLLNTLLGEEVSRANVKIMKTLALANLRLGERSNCITHHASESCIVPISGLGVHKETQGSTRAIEIYTKLLEVDPKDLESRWLMNIAYMTLGQYPDEVPEKYLIPGMEGDTSVKVKPFEDGASDLKIDVVSTSGGSIVDDFDNDGYLDIIISAWEINEQVRYFRNNADGTFTDLTGKAGLTGITGGLNILQADYNNDGNKDFLILRGAWKGEYGREPNSLLRNNGDGTFTDVTTASGILSFNPTQTATWNDFNNDGWLDLYIGNESINTTFGLKHPSELYINNGDGTFREVGTHAQCNVIAFVKGVTSGDYDNDGWQDIFLSTTEGRRILLRNKGIVNGEVQFEDVTTRAGLSDSRANTFPTWFWDYDNDGWLDIFTCDYSFTKPLSYYAAAEKLNIPIHGPEKMLLYRNNQDGTFTNVTNEAGLDTYVFAMGSNFGDIDNDGYLDMYLGTGNPQFESVTPNRMFKNIDGKKFVDVTASARVGHLQKGHGVSFADMDNDGDQDIHVEMGGAFIGDGYQNSFFINPGQNDNKWICVDLVGTKSNRAAIGTRVKATFNENGVTRSVYRDVNSGGSFGASPLRREIGIGQAQQIDKLEIFWHGSNEVQVFHDVKPNQFIRITEGRNEIEKVDLKVIEWILPNRLCLPETTELATR